MANPFTHTKAALAAFDAAQAGLDALRDGVKCNADVEAWEAACIAELRKVQDAFYEDTKAFNRPDNCHRVDIAFMRRVAA